MGFYADGPTFDYRKRRTPFNATKISQPKTGRNRQVNGHTQKVQIKSVYIR